MQSEHGRELVIDGPLTLRLWPQPAVTVQGVRLSEPGQPGSASPASEEASLTLHLQPLLARREIEVDRVAARGVQLRLRRDADGRRNVADLMARATGSGGGERRPASPWAIEGVVLDQLELDVADAVTGVSGRVAVQQFSLGRFGPGLVSPLHLQGQAMLTQPALSAALVLDAGLELPPAATAGASPVVRFDKPSLQLRGRGFGVEALDARLQAASARLDYGAAGFGDRRVDLDGVQLQFGGTWLGWQIDSGRLALARLHLDGLHRRALDSGTCRWTLPGRRGKTTLDCPVRLAGVSVTGASLQGGSISGRLTLGGDESCGSCLSSQAPGGGFERIIVPSARHRRHGRIGPSAVRGQAEATLVLERKPFAAALDPLTLAIRRV